MSTINFKVTNKRTALGSVDFTKKLVIEAEKKLGVSVAQDITNQLKNSLGKTMTDRGFFKGRLKDSINFKKNKEGEYEIFMLFWGLFLERGTKGSVKKAPPALVNWVRTKGPTIGLSNKGKPIITMEDAREVADKIRKHGTRAYPFIKRTLENYDPSPELNNFKTKVEI